MRGSVEWPVSLDAIRDDPAPPVRIIGSYFGEPPLLVLVVEAVIDLLQGVTDPIVPPRLRRGLHVLHI